MRHLLIAVAACAGLVVAACGSSSTPASPSVSENSPPGDIPDNQAYVAYAPPGAGYSVKVPEGWSRSKTGAAVSFTDKLNTVQLAERSASARPTVARVRRTMLAQGVTPGSISVVGRTAGPAVRIAYLADSKPDPVTGKARLDAVERYVFFHNGREAVLTLSGPKGADNVDPWRIITDSLRWTR